MIKVDFFFTIYRAGISPFLHALCRTLSPASGCRFAPTCSAYARDALGTFPLHRALFLIGRRILRCHPFSEGGIDPVQRPPARKSP